MTRDDLGRLVREAWVKYCIETGDTKPSHLTPYDELSEWDKEADRRIGEAVEKSILEHHKQLQENPVSEEAAKRRGGRIVWADSPDYDPWDR